MTELSTHVLDTTRGRPAAGITVTLHTEDGRADTAQTNEDGRAAGLGGPEGVGPGTHRLVFETGAYVAPDGTPFFPSVTVSFTVTDQPRLHIPVLLSPYSYTVYRGS